ncbi:Piso0_000887 [Millerozyma farinosa CBS 7064]|uniref:Mannan endo-1,6-alpha-mannosidase n=1 Tax=Pichia sorbitophila (strain ATCC MYA-4447 / BCRC 22081 / CBS 7064 / NBRC 10061 / NRRL Y-12695) TaxID=559304 RepID=G8YQC0_PICSO|nr:Piso0_000887 [Millerozyma farinosa CBS 7064]
MKLFTRYDCVLLLLFLFNSLCFAVDINPGDVDSVCSAAKKVADGEFNYYEGIKKGGTVGMFTYPYYWWHAGCAFGGLLDYFTFCDKDNSTLKEIIYDGMYHQAGDNYDYIPSNQSMTEGNDDQGIWGLTTMEAAERNFTDPPHSWLSMTQAIYNTMNDRWDSHCNGGLRWQIFTWNSGYNYKNSIANGCLFQIAARLARYTGNDTYAKTAEKVWDWMSDVGFIGEDDNHENMYIYDGADISNNCSDVTKTKWTYIYGVFIAGCAYMHSYNNDSVWLDRVNEILKASTSAFFKNDTMYEASCEPDRCNNDQTSFKSLFARSLAQTAVLIPETSDTIMNLLDKSASAAGESCSGGTDGVTCGTTWTEGKWDDTWGLGQQMSALETMLGTIIEHFHAPYTDRTGGTSKSEPNAGIDTHETTNRNLLTISGKDKAGAGVLTAGVLAIVLGCAVWMAI